ncbi:MAG: hypothetical protein JWP89_2748 [Schlesneria sp.]|nr:hypothetical protein [Schlesneria sp.]
MVAALVEHRRSTPVNIDADRIKALVERIEMQDLELILRQAIKDSGKTHYAIGKLAEVAPGVLDRFVAGTRGITLATASKVAGVLGLGLMTIDQESYADVSAKKPKKKVTKRN